MAGVVQNWQEKEGVLKINRPGCFEPKVEGLPSNLSADCMWAKTDEELGKDSGRGAEDMANVYRMVQAR